MNKQKKNQKNRPEQKVHTIKSTSIIERLENRCIRHEKILILLIIVLAAVFSALSFDLKISTGYDDSEYIYAGKKYANDFFNYFYEIKGPLYPMTLSILIKFFGINLFLLKLLSTLFFIGFVFITYHTFKGVIPFFLLFTILLLTVCNSYFLFYASMTYSEAMYLFMQSLVFYFFVKLLALEQNAADLSKSWKTWLFLGITMLLIHLTRNIGIGAFIAFFLYFLVRKKFKEILFLIGTAMVFEGAYYFVKKIIWGNILHYTAKSADYLYKDPYNPSKGVEDFRGIVNRFFDNCQSFYSSRFWEIAGFKSNYAPSVGLTFITILIIICGAVYVFLKKNNALLSLSIYFTIVSAITFITVGAQWAQERMILIFFPYILMVVFFGLYKFFMQESRKWLQPIFILMLMLFLFYTGKKTFATISKNVPVLKHNIKGETLNGYSTDWVNYLALSKWCEENLPDSSYVACRKASMSFIYANGKEFYGIGKGPTPDETPEDLLRKLKKAKATHVIIANLRANPEKCDGNIINTLQRYFYPIVEKYPYALKEVHRIGQLENAVLYEIIYPPDLKD